MNTWTAYQDAAQAYASGVRTFFVPAVGPVPADVMRGMAADPAGLMQRAEKLAPLSDEFTLTTSGLLAHDDPMVRLQAATRLMAKALTDLQVSSRLLEAAQAERKSILRPRTAPATKEPDELEQHLGIILANPLAGPGLIPQQQRGAAIVLPPDLQGARLTTARAMADVLASIRDQAARSGQMAVAGLLGLGTTELAQAVGVVGMDIARAVGQGEQLNRLYGLFRDFAMKGYNALLALLGPALARMAANQFAAWIAALKSGEEFSRILDKLYQTSETAALVGQLASASQASPDQFAAASQAMVTLRDHYTQQTQLTDKLLRGLALFGIAPAAALPQGKVILAAAFIILGSYIILTGADFVDAPRLRLLNRVPGVREIAARNLGPLPVEASGSTAGTGAAAQPASGQTTKPATAPTVSIPASPAGKATAASYPATPGQPTPQGMGPAVPTGGKPASLPTSGPTKAQPGSGAAPDQRQSPRPIRG